MKNMSENIIDNVNNDNLYCNFCDNKGYYNMPIDEDMEKYDAEFDRLDVQGIFNHEECRERALRKCKVFKHPCPLCMKGGLLKKNKYEIK